MKKRWRIALLLLVLLLPAACIAEDAPDWSTAYDAYYLNYDAGSLSGWEQTAYADREGVLLYMHRDGTEVSVSLQERSVYPTLENLAEMQLAYVESYGSLVGTAEQQAWSAPWNAEEHGLRLAYSYTFARSEADAVYSVVKYMAGLDDSRYLMVEVTDRSGGDAAAELEGGFLRGLSVGSFSVSGNSSAFLTGAEERDGTVYVMLQPYEVRLSEDGTEYSVSAAGDAVSAKVSPEARIMAPADRNTGMLADIGCTAEAINGFVEAYRSANGGDCAFTILHSAGVVRWMTYSYLY